MIEPSVPDRATWSSASILTSLAVLVAALALVLVASYAWFVPLQTDGGWYSYPGYALSQGRDPSENLMPVDEVVRHSSGIRAVFGWENRSFLIVRLHAAWFALAGTTLLSLKAFGALQWLLVTALVAAAVWTSTRSRIATLVSVLAVMSDSWLISESMADLRPDLPIAVSACACVVATLRYMSTFRWRWIIVASAFALLLPLLHTTGVMAFAFCAVLTGVLAVAPAPGARTGRLVLLLVVASGVLAFLFRQPIVDVLVPTALPEAAELPYRHNLATKLSELLQIGAIAKLKTEIGRWGDYFLVSNVAHLVLVGVGVCGLVVSVVRRGATEQRALRLALVGGVVAAPAVLFLDPHPTPSHVVPLAALLYVASGVGLWWFLAASASKVTGRALIVLGLLAASAKSAHAYQLIRTSVAGGVSNKNVAALVADTLEPGPNRLAVAPTWTWPYVDPTRSVVLIEPGTHSREWSPADPRWQSTHVVILDRDFLYRGWDQIAQAMVRCGAFVEKGSVGQRSGSEFYLASYKVVGPCADAKH